MIRSMRWAWVVRVPAGRQRIRRGVRLVRRRPQYWAARFDDVAETPDGLPGVPTLPLPYHCPELARAARAGKLRSAGRHVSARGNAAGRILGSGSAGNSISRECGPTATAA